MKKRLLSLLLVITMVFSAFILASCGENDDEEVKDEVEYRVNTTLTLWLPAAEGTEIDPASVLNVESAINEFTQKSFNTAIKLKVFPADEYDSFVISKICEIKEAKDIQDAKDAEARRKKIEEANKAASGETTSADSDGTTAADSETVNEEDIVIESDTNQYILPAEEDGKRAYDREIDVKSLDPADAPAFAENASLFNEYPPVESDQFDIFLIHGYDEFEFFNTHYLLEDMTSSIVEESRAINDFVNKGFIKGALVEGILSFIPNNRPVGESEVMLINKKVCEELYYDPARFDSVDSLFTYDNSGISFIEDVKKSLPDIVPVAGQLNAPNTEYFSLDDDGSFSIISSMVSPDLNDFNSFSMVNTFKNSNYINTVRNEKRIKDISDFADIETCGEFAVGFFTGTYDEIKKYEDDYAVVTIQNPKLTREDVFAKGFAISTYTKSFDRAMEIITAINTNTELRTILQYGREGVHWRYDVEDGSVINVLSDKYQMDITETGNVFCTFPGADRPISDWSYAKENNLKLYLPYTYGFVSDSEKTSPLLEQLKTKSSEIKARVDAMSFNDFTNNLDALKKEVDSLDYFQKLTYVFTNTDDDNSWVYEESLYQMFYEYINNRGWNKIGG